MLTAEQLSAAKVRIVEVLREHGGLVGAELDRRARLQSPVRKAAVEELIREGAVKTARAKTLGWKTCVHSHVFWLPDQAPPPDPRRGWGGRALMTCPR